MPKKHTIEDIARIAGVSRGTVSRVLNNHPSVSDEYRQKVLNVIDALNYRPSLSAREMRTGESGLIGFVTNNIATTPHAFGIIEGAQNEVWQHDKLLLVLNTEGDKEIEQRAIELLLARGVDGIIYATMFHQPVEPPEIIGQIPFVLVNCYAEDPTLSWVIPDEVGGGYLATKTLLKQGHTKVGFINLDRIENRPAAKGRFEGYVQAHEEYGVPVNEVYIREGNSNADMGYLRTKELMQLPNPPTALFCSTDRTAMGAYFALLELGLSIPDDVAVVGFDNEELIAAYLHPPLTTLALPHHEMGQWGVKHLLAISADSDQQPIHEALPCPLVSRQSVEVNYEKP